MHASHVAKHKTGITMSVLEHNFNSVFSFRSIHVPTCTKRENIGRLEVCGKYSRLECLAKMDTRD